MITARQRRTASMLLKLAEMMRREEANGWNGLRRTAGDQPSRTGANLFFLGAAIDGGRQPADVAWRSAQRFVFGVVPPAERSWLWDWIVRRHSSAEWRRKRRAYGLHRTRAWHERVYRFAEFISKYLEGDPRNIWRRPPTGVDAKDHVLSVLHTMRFGPTLSRMVVGALLDHRLVEGEAAFKDDIHVCRGMQRLRLSPSARSFDVLQAGRRFFGGNSWKVDLALFRLGQRGYTTRAAIERYLRERVDAGRDKRVRNLWARRRAAWRKVMQKSGERVVQRLGRERWFAKANSDKDFIGFTLSPLRGRAQAEVRNEYLVIWSGCWLNSGEATIEIRSELGFDIDGPVACSLAVRDWLKSEGYKCDYEDSDRWETHYKLLRRIPVRRRPENIARSISGAISRASEGLPKMLETRIG